MLAPPVRITNSLGINGGFQLKNVRMMQIAFHVMNVSQRRSEMPRAQYLMFMDYGNPNLIYSYCSSLVGGERSHERIWSLALSCWFSSQDSGRVFLLGALTFTLEYFFLLQALFFFFFLSSFNLNSSLLDHLL